MRRKNWRLVILGVILIALAVGFYISMMSLAPQSTDPVELMKTAGGAAGVVIGVSVAFIITGLIGKKA